MNASARAAPVAIAGELLPQLCFQDWQRRRWNVQHKAEGRNDVNCINRGNLEIEAHRREPRRPLFPCTAICLHLRAGAASAAGR